MDVIFLIFIRAIIDTPTSLQSAISIANCPLFYRIRKPTTLSPYAFRNLGTATVAISEINCRYGNRCQLIWTLSEVHPRCVRGSTVVRACHGHGFTTLSVRSHLALMSDKVQICLSRKKKGNSGKIAPETSYSAIIGQKLV